MRAAWSPILSAVLLGAAFAACAPTVLLPSDGSTATSSVGSGGAAMTSSSVATTGAGGTGGGTTTTTTTGAGSGGGGVTTTATSSSTTAAGSGGAGSSTSTSSSSSSSSGAGGGGAPGTGGGTPGVTEAVAFGMDTAHTGAQPNETLMPPLQQRWSVTLGKVVSYPVIAGGRVFVAVRPSGGTGTTVGAYLYAFDLQTGAKDWGPLPLGGKFWQSNVAYDAGKVFANNFDGALSAFDAATGVMLWQVPGPYGSTSSAPPTARGGRVYFGRGGGLGEVVAVDEGSGAVVWSAQVIGGEGSSPVVTDTGVYVAYQCNQVYAFHPKTGALLWHYQTTPCSSGGGDAPVLFQGRLYTRDDVLPNLIFDAATGAKLGSFPKPAWSLKGRKPTFHGALGFFILDSGLVASDASTLATVWSFPVDDMEFLSAPIVVNGVVYVLSTTGMLRALSESDGTLLWSTDTGGAISLVDSEGTTAPVTGLAAAGGALVVPAGQQLIAYW